MKQVFKIVNYKAIIQKILVPTFVLLLLTSNTAYAQTDSAKKEEPAEETGTSLIAPSIEFITVQKGDNTIDLKTALKSKIKGSFIKLPLLKVSFFHINGTTETALGFRITDKNGKADFNIKADSLKTDDEGKLHFKAVFAGNKQMDAAEGEMTIKRARLEITPIKDDSLITVQVKLIDIGTGTEKPVPETVLGIFMHRLFNPLKIGEGTTDENGEASIEIPSNLTGDEKGNITLLAKLDENETYGNLEATVTQKWGIPLSDKMESQQRALWSTHPPMWMLITFIILMLVVWGHYIVIVFELFRLRKEEPHQA